MKGDWGDARILVVVPRYELRATPHFANKINYNYFFPLGLGYISSVLKKTGCSVDCLNLNHYNGTTEELIEKALNRKEYDFVCTGNNALGYDITEKIIKSVKKHESKPKFILGGHIITSEPELVFNELKIDFGVLGEGEETIIELLEHLNEEKDIKRVKGIIYKNKNNKVIITEKREPVKNIDTLPWPDFEGFEFEKQLDNLHCNYHYTTHAFDYPRVYPILGSRGCPFNCTFCYHDSVYRNRSIDNIMEELNTMVRKYKINVILPYDECLAANKQRLFDLCKEIKKLREEISWELRWSPQLTVHNIDREAMEIMKDSGVDTVAYGFESCSSKVLKSMRKPITPELINRAFHETMNAKIGIQANLIFGDVAETKETAKETLDWWEKNCKGQVGMGFIQPYPGSRIYEHCLEKGIIKDKLEFIKNGISLDNWYNMTNNMSDEEIKQLKKEILSLMSKYLKFVRPISMKKMKENIYEFKVRCPYCGKINDYKNCFIKNKWSYGFYMLCRECHMRFFIVSFIQKAAYKHYPKVRGLRDLQLKMSDYIKKKVE